MRRQVALLLVPLLVLLVSGLASAAEPVAPITPIQPLPILVNPDLLLTKQTVPVAFSAVANRYTGVDPATQFDLNGDLVADLKVNGNTLNALNGAGILLLDPPALNLDQVQAAPSAGYGTSAPVQFSRVYMLQLKDGSYAKFMLLQTAPKVTIWFHWGRPTSSVLQAKGEGGHAVLTWDALPDAAIGYSIYRYEISDNSYTVTQLNDFTVEGTTFTDNTASNRYYVYVVQAMKAGGTPGSLTTAAAVFVTSLQRTMLVRLNATTATLDGANVTLAQKPVIRDGRMMVPASLFTHAGTKLSFDSGSGKLTLSRRLENVTYTVVMTLDVPEYTWNGNNLKLDVSPYKVGSEVMVPLRNLAPALGIGVSFQSPDKTASLGWFE